MLRFTYTIAFILFSIVLFTHCGGTKGSYNKYLISTTQQKPILITNVSIFNGKDHKLSYNQDVFIKNGIIQSISQANKTTYQEAQKIIEGKGKFLIPGLIDAHVHIASNGSPPWDVVKPDPVFNLNAYLYAGITTVYDLGGLANKTQQFRKNTNQ